MHLEHPKIRNAFFSPQPGEHRKRHREIRSFCPISHLFFENKKEKEEEREKVGRSASAKNKCNTPFIFMRPTVMRQEGRSARIGQDFRVFALSTPQNSRIDTQFKNWHSVPFLELGSSFDTRHVSRTYMYM